MSSLKRFGVLGGGVFCLGWAAIFFRLADEAPALTVAAYRLAIASVLLVGLAGFSVRAGYARLPARRHWPVMALSGAFLALHFWSWFASLERTSVA